MERNCQIAWDRLESKYISHTALSLLKLKSKFHNSKLESIEKDPNEWISKLDRFPIQMSKFGLICYFTDEDFMIHVMNNLHEEYDVIRDGLENCLTLNSDDALTIEFILEKLNHQYKKIKNKSEEKRKRKRKRKGLRSL